MVWGGVGFAPTAGAAPEAVLKSKGTESKAAESKAAEPKAAESKAAESKAAEPKAAEPKAAEPKAARPTIIRPIVGAPPQAILKSNAVKPVTGAAPEAVLKSKAAKPVTGAALAELVTTGADARLAAIEAELSRLQVAVKASANNTKKKTGKKARKKGDGARILDFFANRAKAVSEAVIAGVAFLGRLPEFTTGVLAAVADPEMRSRILIVLLKLFLILGAALAAEWVAGYLLARPRRAVEGRESDSLAMRLPLLAGRTLLDVMPLVAFAAAAYAVLMLTEPDRVTRLVALTLINANVLARAVLVVARMVIAPRIATLRIFSIANETASYLFLWVRRLTNTSIYGYFTIEAAGLLGLPPTGYEALLKLLGLVLASLLMVLILQNRPTVAKVIRGDASAETGARAAWFNLRGRFADVWHVLTILYVIAAYGIWLFEVPDGFAFLLRATVLTVLILVVTRLVLFALTQGIERGFAVSREAIARFPNLEVRANRYLYVFRGILRTVIYVLTILLVLHAWGIDSFSWLATDMGRNIVGTSLNIAAVLLIAFLSWVFVSALIERALLRTEGVTAGGWMGPRARTLLPLLRNVVFVTLTVLVVFVVLSEIGINIAPLLAGAGIVGLAVGFGAQTLVKDVITGVFILLEDTVAVGDVVNLGGGHAGVVEKMSIRAIRLRDLSGNVHTVPFSAVSTVLNMTKDFSYYLFEVGIAYREDVDEVSGVLCEIGAEMQADPVFGPQILAPLEVLGLDKFADSAVILKARIKTRPIKQWGVGREFNRRMKIRFDELGIEIPFPHQTIYFGEDKAGTAPPARIRVERAVAARSSARSSAMGETAQEKPAPKPRPAPPKPSTAATDADSSDSGYDGDGE
jgi:small conductance mechanosensitive channel